MHPDRTNTPTEPGLGGRAIQAYVPTHSPTAVSTRLGTLRRHTSAHPQTHTSPPLWTAHTSRLAKKHPDKHAPVHRTPYRVSHANTYMSPNLPTQGTPPRYQDQFTPAQNPQDTGSCLHPLQRSQGMRFGSRSDPGMLLPYQRASLTAFPPPPTSPPPPRPTPAGGSPSRAPSRAQSP